MKRNIFNLNQAYIDRTTKFVNEFSGTLTKKEKSARIKEELQTARKRLNEQARDCEPYIAQWALMRTPFHKIMETLVDWNNHTLANHPEIVNLIYRETINRADFAKQTLTYTHYPTKKELAEGIHDTYDIAVPFAKCMDTLFGDIQQRVYKGKKSYTFRTF